MLRSRLWPMLAMAAALLAMATVIGRAADYPAPREGSWVARDFRFHTGQTLSEVTLHYRTLGDPAGEPVLILHGTSGSGAGMLTQDFAGQLFGPGQPLDARRHFIILPDALGHGRSAKPSDGMRARFPEYDYDDMVLAQYRLITEGLGIRHLRLVLGNSMGGMQAWLWGVAYPEMMDGLVPMASQPTEMAGRNWLTRRMIVDGIRADPAWQGGDYAEQPRSARFFNVFFAIATSGGNFAWQAAAPTREKAEAILDQRMAAPFNQDANDFLYQWNSSRGFNASPRLERIVAPLLAINAADDERNPPETGIMERELRRLPNARLLLIPASAETRGHGTTGFARFWAKELGEFLDTLPRRTASAR
ncbi:alpha/beta fold hydrolase [Roseomonas sp. OT10]|uniref:alpha/beta fold hydrolase n=1 Tax=Roseomonas cutis TaxID=2897332 RepID=UPI001E284073|nr:alpha/beta fold hydrolase [Roseomonas sp. OT10]UFN47615.1 alpha/beta fold hydrolase [Roseomonas sp. OT10]